MELFSRANTLKLKLILPEKKTGSPKRQYKTIANLKRNNTLHSL